MSSLTDLLTILDIEPLEQNLFRGHVPQVGWKRVFGGLVIAQALVAAQRTVENRPVHSLHAYFLLGGDPSAPIIYEVDRIRDGRSFATRRVVAIQHGHAIFSLAASFHAGESGYTHAAQMPDVPMPEDISPFSETSDELRQRLPHPVRAYFERQKPIELRPVNYERFTEARDGRYGDRIWFKANGPLPDDPAVHRCLLAYASDMTLLDASLLPHGVSVFDPEIGAASLDHAMWFHRPFRADEWMLYAQDSPSAAGGLGFSRGLIFQRDGTLIASVAQEGLIRPLTPKVG